MRDGIPAAINAEVGERTATARGAIFQMLNRVKFLALPDARRPAQVAYHRDGTGEHNGDRSSVGRFPLLIALNETGDDLQKPLPHNIEVTVTVQ